jgi:hypothetical protein
MFAFVDETGNTGANIFDKNQPDFMTAALVTRSNFDLVHSRALETICKNHCIDALHASVLGFGPIERAAREILALLKKVDARFFVSRVEKRYLVATKVFDTFFDSGENPAVPWSSYNIRPLRLILAFKVASILTDEIAQEFWSMLTARNEKLARGKIPSICNAILENVPYLSDLRSRQIVTDALTWSRDHPQALDIFIAGRQAKNGHMPNMVAFANLLDGLDTISKRWGSPLRTIVHDRQSQFEGTLEEWHRVFSNASDEPIQRPGETIVFQKVAGSTFTVSASDESAGIQIADLALWLYRQYLSGRPMPAGAGTLLNYVFKKGLQQDFSFKGVGAQVERAVGDIMNKDISEEATSAGRRLIAEQEKRRLELVQLYEVDGLMPYERERTKLIPPQNE